MKQEEKKFLAPEKINAVQAHPELHRLSDLLSYWAETPRKIDDPARELSMDTVLNICSSVTGIAANVLRGRRKYEVFRGLPQDIFYAAAYCYTSLSYSEIANYCGCQVKTVGSAVGAMRYYLNDSRRDFVMAVMLECEQLSKRRVAKNVKSTTIETIKDMGATVSTITNPIALMSLSEIQSLPVRPAAWFEPRYRQFRTLRTAKRVFCFRVGCKSVYKIDLETDEVIKAVHGMQQFGYRFMTAWGEEFIAEQQGCDTCHLGRSGKCPAAVMESYFCLKRRYDEDMSPTTAVTIEKGKEFKNVHKN